MFAACDLLPQTLPKLQDLFWKSAWVTVSEMLRTGSPLSLLGRHDQRCILGELVGICVVRIRCIRYGIELLKELLVRRIERHVGPLGRVSTHV